MAQVVNTTQSPSAVLTRGVALNAAPEQTRLTNRQALNRPVFVDLPLEIVVVGEGAVPTTGQIWPRRG